jgi:hypothetical protein
MNNLATDNTSWILNIVGGYFNLSGNLSGATYYIQENVTVSTDTITGLTELTFGPDSLQTLMNQFVIPYILNNPDYTIAPTSSEAYQKFHEMLPIAQSMTFPITCASDTIEMQ